MNANQIKVVWVNGNQQWCIVGGGLPQHACWDAFDSLAEANREAEALADDIGCEFVR